MMQLDSSPQALLATTALQPTGKTKAQFASVGQPRRDHVLDERRDNSDLRTPTPDVANVGPLRPPFVYLASIVLGMLLHFVWPARLVSASVSTPLGVVVTLLAVALFVSAVRTLRAAGTPIPGNRPTMAIVRTGPYRFSRNPIYLAFTLFQIGLSFWVNSLALLATLIPVVALMSLIVIPREERYLEARFPSEYLPYKASVRRWL
jgi:protein-S-isoprenylcysteine O-methyltransferase Ste14